MREASRWVLMVLLIAGLVLFLSFQAEAKGEGNRLTSRINLGFPWPWFDQTTEYMVTDGKSEQVAESGGLRLMSPAWLILGGVIGSGFGLYRLRSRQAEGGS